MTSTLKLISVDDAAEYLGMSPKTVRNWVSEGKLTGYRVGTRALRLDLNEVESLIEPIPTAAAHHSKGHHQPRRLPCPECSRPTSIDGVLVADGLVRALCEHREPLCTECCEANHL